MARLLVKETSQPVKRYSFLSGDGIEYRVMKVESTGDLIVRDVNDTKLIRIPVCQTDLHDKLGLYKVKE
ncbi:hypothetical protein SJ_138 [Proteus phage SJ_PmiM]|nr:hypothetical protein SJ_138 [Proteus phage SJ_PmiM]